MTKTPPAMHHEMNMKFYPDNGRPMRRSEITRRRNDEVRLAVASQFGGAYALYDILGESRLDEGLKRSMELELSRPFPQRKYTTKKEELAFRQAYLTGAKQLIPLVHAGSLKGWSAGERENFWGRFEMWVDMEEGVGMPRVAGGRPVSSGAGAGGLMLPTFISASRRR